MSEDSRVILSNDVGLRLSHILGLRHVVDIDLSFHLNECARATVTFLINDIQAEAIVQLLENTKWGQPNV